MPTEAGWLEASSPLELDVQVGLDGLIPSRQYKTFNLFVYLLLHSYRIFWELYRLWRKRISVLHRVFQSYQPEVNHSAKEAEALKVLPSKKLPRCTVKGTPYLLER